MWVIMTERLENMTLNKMEMAHYKSLSSTLGFEPSSRAKLVAGLSTEENPKPPSRMEMLMGKQIGAKRSNYDQ
jgi:phage terminase small subunit